MLTSRTVCFISHANFDFIRSNYIIVGTWAQQLQGASKQTEIITFELDWRSRILNLLKFEGIILTECCWWWFQNLRSKEDNRCTWPGDFKENCETRLVGKTWMIKIFIKCCDSCQVKLCVLSLCLKVFIFLLLWVSLFLVAKITFMMILVLLFCRNFDEKQLFHETNLKVTWKTSVLHLLVPLAVQDDWSFFYVWWYQSLLDTLSACLHQ